MNNTLDWVAWIALVDLPALAGLLMLIWRTRQENGQAIDGLQDLLSKRTDQMREALSAFKLEVAKTYASQTDLKALEDRLVSHLLRIETKLDATALKAEAAKAKSR
ncbi:MAG: hypothetical protein IT559_06525 [Alphaproteobacteria bacterium]|nr:hypothetical protein [Alphaproteobacteria bacterium]